MATRLSPCARSAWQGAFFTLGVTFPDHPVIQCGTYPVLRRNPGQGDHLRRCVLQPRQLLAAGGSVERALFHPIGSDGEGQPCRLKPLRLSTAPAAVSFLVWRNESPKGSSKLPQGRGRAATSGVMALDDVSRPSPYCNGLPSLMRRRFALHAETMSARGSSTFVGCVLLCCWRVFPSIDPTWAMSVWSALCSTARHTV
jgi:hypothetical protein